jgi:hypothetical protein
LIGYLSKGTIQELLCDPVAGSKDFERNKKNKIMTRHNILKTVQVVFIGACTMLCASTGQAETVSFHVGVNTSTLVGNSNGPFSLDFQLNSGGGPNSNAVTLDDFTFTGTAAAPSGSPTLIGNATGSLSSGVSLNDSGGVDSEFFQGFTAGTTEIQFDAFVTENVDAVTPDAFVMAVLDGNLANIPTNSADGDDSLMVVNISASNLSLANVQRSTSIAPDAGVTVTVSPEPGTSGMFLLAGLLAAGWMASRGRATVR